MPVEISNEGAAVHIDWHLLTPGASFFIPAIQVIQLAREVRNAATKRNIRLIHRVCVYNNMYGIRFWREP